jgi:hypothetical protein
MADDPSCPAGHCRPGFFGSSDAFDRALATFAVAYADQNERDCETGFWL